jgi:hypothetical protein
MVTRRWTACSATASGGGVTLTWQGERAGVARAVWAARWAAGGGGVGGAQGGRRVGRAGEGPDAGVPGDDGAAEDVEDGEGHPGAAGHQDTPENEEIYKWNVFWDAPLAVPGTDSSHLVGPARTQAEIKRAKVSYKSDACAVKTDGDRVSVTFNGLTLGLFAGDLEFTAYKGSNLLRQEAVASTQAKDVAFIYKAGLKGFALKDDTKLVWRDTSQLWQEKDFGGDVNEGPVKLQARNRLEILETGLVRVAGVFPPPHKFFFARENEVNLGYVYYRKDAAGSFSLGVMQPERGEGYKPWGVSDEVWRHRSSTARNQVLNYALYNAPPGTMQRMAVYYYLSATGSHATDAGGAGSIRTTIRTSRCRDSRR